MIVHSRGKELRSKHRQRGAALVEAALVLPTLAIFLGLILYEYRSYREKMISQQTTRTNVLYFASHACDEQATVAAGGLSNVAATSAAYALDTAPVSGADKVLNGNPPGGGGLRSKTQRTFNEAQSTVTRQASGGGLTRKVTSTSRVYCNERPEDGDPGGVAQWAFGFFKSGL
jgi:hypothetical protein